MTEQLNLSTAVHDLVREELSRGPVRRDWIVDQIMARCSDCYGPDAELHMGSTRWRLEQQVNAHAGKFSGRRSAPTISPATAATWDARQLGAAQIHLDLPGYDCLQTAYSFDRKGEILLIPIDQCSVAELRQRANEYRIQSAGCLKHARELDDYCDERERQVELAFAEPLSE